MNKLSMYCIIVLTLQSNFLDASNIGMSHLIKNTYIVESLMCAENFLNIAFSIEDAIYFISNKHATKITLYKEFFQDHKQELQVLQENDIADYIGFSIPDVVPEQK